MNRAYSLLTVKAVDEDARIIEGLATSPAPDRMGDIVEPMGAKFALPIPLLWQHQGDNPVGFVESAKRTKDGIPFRARIVKIAEPGPLKDMVDKAWQAVKAGLVRGVSIGFRALERSSMKDGGLRFIEWEWLELSLVTVPANSDATISTIKSLDAALLAVSGRKDSSGSNNRPGVPGSRNSNARPKEATQQMKTIQMQISDLESKRDQLAEQMKGFGDVTELDDSRTAEYDAVSSEFEKAEKNLGRLQSMARAMGDASAVKGVSPDEGTRSRQGHYDAFSAARDNTPKLEKGIRFARVVRAMMAGRGSISDALEYAKRWNGQTPEVAQYIRATAGTANPATSPGWGSELAFQNNLASEFVELLRDATIVGRIQGFRRVPFNVRIPTQTGGSTVNWVGESAPKPVGELDFSEITIGYTKIAGIVVFSEELSRLSDPNADLLVRNDLVSSVTAFKDAQFITPSVSPTPVRPGAINYDLDTSITASGADAEALEADLRLAFAPMLAANIPGPYYIVMNTNLALGISLLRNTLGQKMFPEMTPQGGTLLAGTVIVSNASPSGLITIIAPAEILLAEDDNVRVDASREATLAMDGGVTAAYSLWQRNNIGVRAEQWVNYKRRRELAVSAITGATYGPVQTS